MKNRFGLAPLDRIIAIVVCSTTAATWTNATLAHPANGIFASLTVDWRTHTDCFVRISLNGTRASNVSQRILIEVNDILGERVGSAVLDQSLASTGGASAVIVEEIDYDVNKNSDVHHVRFSWWNSGTTGEPSGTTIKIIPKYCPNINTESELNSLIGCGKCSIIPTTMPDHYVRVYKKDQIVYTLPEADQSLATFGETVSGIFTAPKCGILRVEVSGSNSNARVHLEAWDAEGGALTRAINDTKYVKKMSQGEQYKFSIRGYRGSVGTVSIFFDWFQWLDSRPPPPGVARDCLEQYKYEPDDTNPGLHFEVQELKLLTVPAPGNQPVRLSGRAHQQGDVIWYEIQMPVCGINGENISETFILPIHSDGKIVDGHAVQWSKSGSDLIAPDPEGLKWTINGF